MKNYRRIMALCMAGVLTGSMLAGCGSSTQQSAQSGNSTSEATEAASTEAAGAATGEDDGIIKIGAICAMTGGNAILGESAQNAIDMAVEEINGSDEYAYKIEIVNNGNVADDAKDAKQAMNAYNKVMADDPDAIVGSYFSSVTLPMAEQATLDGMLLIAAGATNADITLKGDTIFRDCFIDPYQGKMAALFCKEQGYTTAAVIYAKDDDYSNGLKESFVENCEANGIEVVYAGECLTTDTDYSSQAAQANASGADVLYYPCLLDTVPLFVGAARNAGYTGPIMGGDAWDGCEITGLESQFNNCYFTNHYSPEDTNEKVQHFVTTYTEKYGTDSLNATAALYYDAIYMVEEAATIAGATDTASLVQGMTGMSFSGVTGDFTLDENGDAVKSITINHYVDGEIKWYETLGADGSVLSKAE